MRLHPPVERPSLSSESLSTEYTSPINDNVTVAYHDSDSQLQDSSPFLGDCSDVDAIEPSLFFDDDMFDAYRNSTEVVQDVTSSIMELRKSVFDNVIEKISNDTHSKTMEWTTYDELPTDDSYFSVIPTHSPLTSSDFVSSDSRSISPHLPSPKPLESLESRMEGKLVPSQPKRQIKQRGRRSHGEDLIKLYNLPISAQQLIDLDHRQMQALLENTRLTTTQGNMLKEIRRGGRTSSCQQFRTTHSFAHCFGQRPSLAKSP